MTQTGSTGLISAAIAAAPRAVATNDGDFRAVLQAHHAGGSAYAAIVAVPKAAVQIPGEPRYHKVVGQAGKAVERGFCQSCGSQVTVKLERRPDVLGLQAGSLDDPSIYRPMMDVFTASAPPWDI
jgi:hypothetical protein